MINDVIEDRIHERLKGGWGIAKAKGHDEGFKKAKRAFEGSFPFFTFADTDVVVTSVDVKLGKIAGALAFVYEVGNEG